MEKVRNDSKLKCLGRVEKQRQQADELKSLKTRRSKTKSEIEKVEPLIKRSPAGRETPASLNEKRGALRRAARRERKVKKT